jgi:alpha-glucosidase (family GH31 glycosyl hydrolase)
VLQLLNYNPVANSAAVVVSGSARFTVLTPQLIRIEYDPKGVFEDRATLAFVNRNLTVPSFTSNTASGILTIRTSFIQVQYTVGQPFTSSSLSVVGVNSSSTFKAWNPSLPNTGNLLGTIRSLDEEDVISLNCTVIANVTVHDENLHCAWGLVSRNGWSLVDDTQNYALDSTDWWAGPNSDQVDWYLFAHGWDYKQALQDYTMVGGKIAMVPRAASGIWWSRWYNYNDYDVHQVVRDYETRAIPLDVYILDMDWYVA